MVRAYDQLEKEIEENDGFQREIEAEAQIVKEGEHGSENPRKPGGR